MRINFLVLVIGTLFLSCDSSSARKEYEGLPFADAENAKEYADLIIKAIKTNRDKPIAEEFSNTLDIDDFQLRRLVGMYSTGITGRSDWEEYDIHELSKEKDASNGFDYAWLEPRGRLGMQIFVLPIQNKNGRFTLQKLELRSRIDVMESMAFPFVEISNYKKIDFDWD